MYNTGFSHSIASANCPSLSSATLLKNTLIFLLSTPVRFYSINSTIPFFTSTSHFNHSNETISLRSIRISSFPHKINTLDIQFSKQTMNQSTILGSANWLHIPYRFAFATRSISSFFLIA